MPPEISVLAELDRAAIPYQWSSDDEVKIRCPFHDDDKPSCGVSVSKRVFCCHAGQCGRKGDIVTLLSKVLGFPRAVVLEELSSRYDLEDVKIVEPEVVERWHADVWKAGPLLTELRKRGVTDDMVRQYKLGEEGGRVTIPVPNDRGDYVNVRKYLPGGPAADKMKNMRGRGSARWYPVDQLKFPAVLLTGGEVKSIVAAGALNKHGIGACWITHGERAIPPKLAERLRGKSVCIGLDVDEAGRKATEAVARGLKGIAAELFVLTYPLDLTAFPKGDVNDFVAGGGDLWELYQTAEPWIEKQAASRHGDDSAEPQQVKLAAASNAANVGKRLTVTAIATGGDIAPYFIPKTVTVKCDKSLKECAICPIYPEGHEQFVMSPENPAVLEVVHSPKRTVTDALITAAGIPRTCRICTFEVADYYNAEDVRLSPELEITDRSADQRSTPAVCIGDGLGMNEPYEMTGRVWPHPLTQQSTLLISKYKQTRDALSTYEPTDEQLAALDCFRPAEWTVEGIQAKLDELYGDLEMNVTRIFQRRDMHLAVDLYYHSPLLIDADGSPCKGWTEILIIGDSAQGKSECALRMMQHYGLGERIECKNATTAGLLGGLKQSGTRWMVEWGFLVKNDKRGVILEEVKGMSVDVIGKLTDGRSSGVAELSKIEKTRAHMRTRQLWISNARSDRDMRSYGYPVDAVKELIGALEDVRRFDAVLIVEKGEVDANEINKLHAARNGSHTKYAAELCRGLVLWAWTRGIDACCFDKAVGKLCLSEATRLSEMFSDSIPILDRGSSRYKLARLAAALAARTYSTSEDRRSLVVRECHVQFVSQWLEKIYSRPACGYLQMSQATRAIEAVADPDVVRKNIAALPFPHDFASSVLRAEKIEPQDMLDWCGWGREETQALISLLVRKHALRRDGRGYRKTAAFADLLRMILADRSIPDRPSFIPEGEF